LAQVALPFTDDFTASTLNPAWQVLPGNGSYSVGGGQLTYYNDGSEASTTGWYNPARTLALPFTGTNWEIDIKATYNLFYYFGGIGGGPCSQTDLVCNSAGAQAPKVVVSFNPGTVTSSYGGPNYAGSDYAVIERDIDAGYCTAALVCAYTLSASYGNVGNSNLLNPADISTGSSNLADGTYWYQIIRNGGTLTIKYSYDGVSYATAFSTPLANPSGTYNQLLLGGLTYLSDGSYTNYHYVHITSSCQVTQCVPGVVTDNCVSLSFGVPGVPDPQKYMQAMFFAPNSIPGLPGAPSTLANYAKACGFANFNWQQTVITWPCPGPIAKTPSAVIPADFCPAPAPAGSLAAPFADSPQGGLDTDKAGYDPYPFYYPQNYVNLANGVSCTIPGHCPPFPDIVSSPDGTTLSMVDAPADSNLRGVPPSANPPAGSFVAFFTDLVGVDTKGNVTPLYSWTWNSTFNGTAGGASQTASFYPIDPGSGTGGVTITSINGVPQAPPSVSCTATPNTLWPPNGQTVLVTVSGIVTPGTSALVPGGTAYAVIDEYGQVQPSGGFALGAGATYSFGVSLIAARNGSDKDGRTYTIVVGAKDNVGNVGSCSAVVSVPHDQGN
jgi:hypothetical protein